MYTTYKSLMFETDIEIKKIVDILNFCFFIANLTCVK